ncbi:DNA-binding transcriptional regulator, XRE-family HTH domain [Sinosporangium album]|uniref:DNA-binding transcriptional regulator, XRE-family HTH domain n=1 Tax=Sinosporangium album TaxID=504805 RepID=A0A1G8C9P2_9ACTN|nr:helix-turn-helix transcriptional regulator [Sinosporangium album]SDH42196.1 DNA-binding transcriptional regulator, XRE-family HTH domain [Sinosporangium album]
MSKVPALSERLARARISRGWSQRQLARKLAEVAAEMGISMPERTSLVKSIGNWENGRYQPRHPYPVLLARALGIDHDVLFGDPTPVPTLEIPSLAPDADLYKRITKAIEGPQRIDLATIEWLERCLAEHRRIEDTLGSKPLLPIVCAQLATVVDLARGATGPLSDRIVGTLAQYAQFVAWMCQDSGDLATALHWYDRSHAWALEAGDASLAATTLNMKAHQAWSMGDSQRCVRLAEASRWHEGRTSLGVQGMAAQMAARGHAQLREANEARTLLGEAEELIRRAAERPDEEPAWMYFYGEHWFLMQRGMAELELGEGRRAANLIERGLSDLPESYRRDRAWFGACLARAFAVEGDAEAAASVAANAAPDAAAVNPYAVTELRNTAQTLAEVGAHASAEEMRELVTVAGTSDSPLVGE